MIQPTKLTLALADEHDRASIYAMRHQTYAVELGQHAANAAGRLTDGLDAFNVYLVVKRAGAIAGFVSITPPTDAGYSLDKYFDRGTLPLVFDEGLYEVRLLTVRDSHRGATTAALLMYGALRYVQARGGRTIAGIGRLEVLRMYRRAGLRPLQRRATSGRVTYELMAADVGALDAHAATFERTLSRFARDVDWQLPGVPFRRKALCYHGGAFFEAIGEDFATLEKHRAIVSADVLDAWFDPAPSVVARLSEHLTFTLRTSPPTGCAGMRRAIARARGVPEDAVLPGAGSSDLIFAGLRHWVTAGSRVLILDPMYGEYAHVLDQVIGAQVDRLALSRARRYDLDPDELVRRAQSRYDWIVIVNPNSPTGRHVRREALEAAIAQSPASTRWWIDETYIEYVGTGESVEVPASRSSNVIVCKSMSKVYALSGARAAYLCGPPALLDELRPLCPPWSVSLPAQIAACEALNAGDYYHARWNDTHRFREELAEQLRGLDWDVVPGCANFVLCHLPATGPAAAPLVKRLRARGVFVRDAATMGTAMGERVLRIAVKDRTTNAGIVDAIEATLTEMSAENRAVRYASVTQPSLFAAGSAPRC